MARRRIGANGIHEAVEGGELIRVLCMGPLMEADRFKGRSKRAEGVDVLRACELAQTGVF